MSERLTKSERQKILDSFIEQHGSWDAAAFAEEVRKTKGQHPAWDWFGGFDVDKAAAEHWNLRARQFSTGLVIKFSIETIQRGKVVLKSVEAPYVISPLNTRQHGGGYILVDPTSPEAMGNLCREAATALRHWLKRYDGAVAYVGATTAGFEKLLALLDAPPTVKKRRKAA